MELACARRGEDSTVGFARKAQKTFRHRLRGPEERCRPGGPSLSNLLKVERLGVHREMARGIARPDFFGLVAIKRDAISAGGEKSGAGAEALHQLEAKKSAIELERTFDVRDLEVHVADADLGIRHERRGFGLRLIHERALSSRQAHSFARGEFASIVRERERRQR